MAMYDTIAFMSERKPRKADTSKKPSSEDRHKDPRIVLHLESELLVALDNYKKSLPHDPGRSQIVRDCLRAFLRDRGFYPVQE